MLKRLGDRAALIVALSPAAVFILIAFIAIVGPRLAATPTGTPQITVTAPAAATTAATLAPTSTATSSPQPPPTATATVTPESLIIRRGDFVRLI